jgi:hypothetical protein
MVERFKPPPRRASCPDAAKPRRPPLAGHNTKAGAHCSAVLDNALD